MGVIRRVTLAGLETSCLGFGCASLGSRIDRETGLRALGEAFDAGVRWYDLAPAYGEGAAEEIFSHFLAGRRERLRICTKVGLLAPRRHPLARAIMPIVRRVAGAGRLRALIRRAPGSRMATVEIDGAVITAGIEQSLRRLKTDRIDVFALHMPRAVDLARDDVQRALEDVVASGKALRTAVAGDKEASFLARKLGPPFHVIQLADGPQDAALADLRAIEARPLQTVTHSIFGVEGALAAGLRRLTGRPDLQARLRSYGYDGPRETIVAELLLDRALAANASGVVLASMFNKRHRNLNLARAAMPPRDVALTLSRELFA